MTSTRLTPDRYVELLRVDGEALLAAAEGVMDRPVPTCEGWAVRNVVDHVGMVYAHKVAALQHGRRPEPGEWDGPAAGEDELQWCHGLLHQVAAALAHHAADEPAWSWWEPEQTIGFWQRRMALETAVHRVDVQSATGDVAPLADDLAFDGIDEVLTVMLADAGFTAVGGPTVSDGIVSARLGDVIVSGGPSDVLLWLWSRVGDEAVLLDGDGPAVELVRQILREATQ